MMASIILAAGQANRMGIPKQLLPWGNHTMLEHAIAQVSKSTKYVTVVLGAHADDILKKVSFDVNVVINENWRLGMGSSLALGIKNLPQNVASVLVSLVDQPLLDAVYLNELVAAYQKDPKKIVATDYGNKAGVPAIFPKTYFKQLGKFQEDFGARKLLQQLGDQVLVISPEGKEIDLDTPQEYEKWSKTLGT